MCVCDFSANIHIYSLSQDIGLVPAGEGRVLLARECRTDRPLRPDPSPGVISEPDIDGFLFSNLLKRSIKSNATCLIVNLCFFLSFFFFVSFEEINV